MLPWPCASKNNSVLYVKNQDYRSQFTLSSSLVSATSLDQKSMLDNLNLSLMLIIFTCPKPNAEMPTYSKGSVR
ncbi:Uncharacterized protein TCM_011805 [Theobroma cacao]|uniref:Uncharacterized protein n=1 Tax=Theobroma cacao TaxID=3641 RepID=A0A061ECC9_THECC|nr:Uncharacterized protein TCM_011805 [Theobroma cacao]